MTQRAIRTLPENVAPLSVADMELKNPPEIVEGLKKYIDTHILGYTGAHRGILTMRYAAG